MTSSPFKSTFHQLHQPRTPALYLVQIVYLSQYSCCLSFHHFHHLRLTQLNTLRPSDFAIMVGQPIRNSASNAEDKGLDAIRSSTFCAESAMDELDAAVLPETGASPATQAEVARLRAYWECWYTQKMKKL